MYKIEVVISSICHKFIGPCHPMIAENAFILKYYK